MNATEINKILRMKEGDGEFSYARNSTVQGKIFGHVTKPMIENAIRNLLSNDRGDSCKAINVADLGCGVGPSPVALISTVIEIVRKVCGELKLEKDELPEIQIYTSDLPSNDFNKLFMDLEELQLRIPNQDGMPLCFVMGAPGSFFNRLFPRNGLHLVHSNYALHWISKVPGVAMSMNKGNIIVSESSPENVVKAYRAQFKQDLSLFLKHRSYEVVVEGHMILVLMGSQSTTPHQMCTAKLLCQAIKTLVLKRLIKKEKADSFAMPLHYPSKEEIQEIVIEEGSFTIEKIETAIENPAEEIKDIKARSQIIAKAIRATVEVLVSHHFGEQVWNILHDELINATFQHLEKGPLELFNIFLMLKKNKKNVG